MLGMTGEELLEYRRAVDQEAKLQSMRCPNRRHRKGGIIAPAVLSHDQ
jgi:hypothetical protein